MNKTLTGPEESWDPLNFISPNELDHLISKKSRLDEKESLQIQVDCFSEANGSCYIEMGKKSILLETQTKQTQQNFNFKVQLK